MPSYSALRAYWDRVSANWMLFSLGNQPYLISLHHDVLESRDHLCSEVDPLVYNHDAQRQQSSKTKGRRKWDTSNASQYQWWNSSNTSRIHSSKLTTSTDTENGTAPATMRSSFHEPDNGASDSPLVYSDPNIEVSRIPIIAFSLINPRGSLSQNNVSSVTVNGLIPKQSRASSQRIDPGNIILPRTTYCLSSQMYSRGGAIRNTNHPEPSISMPPGHPSINSHKTSTSSMARNARTSLNRIMDGDLDQHGHLAIYPNRPPTPVRAQSEYCFSVPSDIEAQYGENYQSAPHRSTLWPVSRMGRADLPRLGASGFDSRDDIPHLIDSTGPFPSSGEPTHIEGRRRWDLGRADPHPWYDIDFGARNRWVGIFLLGCIVIIITGGCVVYVWSLSHE